MKVEKKAIEKSQIELTAELSLEEFKPFIEEGVKEISKDIKIDGFRSGKAPAEKVKQKVGEMAILEKAARLAINKNFDEVIRENLKDEQPIGQPRVDITKLAPENSLEFKIVVATLPEITVGKYKDLNIKATEVKVDDKEIDRTLETIRESRAKEVLVDREIKTDDKVVVTIQMFLDKVPIEGGQSQDTAILVGKEYLVPGFDKKLIGAKKGEVKEFELPYPKDFHQKNLAGKMVDFKVNIKDVFEREMPELDDAFAQSLGMKTFAELKKNVKEGTEKEKKQEAERKTEVDIIEAVLETTKYGELPETLINNELDAMMAEMESGITRQGGKFEDYLSSIKKTVPELMLEMTPGAVKRVKSALLLQEIAKIEKIEASEKEIDKKQEDLIKQYKGYEKVEARVKEPSYRAYLHNVMINEKVIAKLKELNIKK